MVLAIDVLYLEHVMYVKMNYQNNRVIWAT